MYILYEWWCMFYMSSTWLNVKLVSEKATYTPDDHSNQNLGLCHTSEMNKVLTYDLQMISAQGAPPAQLKNKLHNQSILHLVNSIRKIIFQYQFIFSHQSKQ